MSSTNKKKYWQSFGELNQSSAYKLRTETKEFAHKKVSLPIEELGKKAVDKVAVSRRDFLKYLGFSTAVATVAASCESHVHKTIPILNPVEGIVPGEASYYATTFSCDGEVVPVVAKVRDGRPIKLAGNDHVNGYTVGHTSARVQASVLGLYDTARLRYPLRRRLRTEKFEKISEAEAQQVDTYIATALMASKGRVALVTNTVSSPTSQAIIHDFTQKFGAHHITYDSISYAALLDANAEVYGVRALPRLHLDKAQLVASIGADFLATWLEPLMQSADWAKTRVPSAKNPTMSKHYQFEAIMSVSGANADERFVLRPSEYSDLVRLLYALVHGESEPANIHIDDKVKAAARKVATALQQHQGTSLLLCDSNDIPTQILVAAINEKIGARTQIIDFSTPSYTKQGSDKDMSAFVADVKYGRYDCVIFANEANPVYDFPAGDNFADALKKIKYVISLGTHMDETTQCANYVFPDHHYLESWGDARLATGDYTFLQPTINPLFKTRNWQSSLLTWAGESQDYAQKVQAFWTNQLGSRKAYDKALQDGVWVGTLEQANEAVFNAQAVTEAHEAFASATSAQGHEIVFYQKVSMGSGKMANNPWLQELPDAITRATWDNYVVVSPAMAATLGIYADDDYEVEPDKPVLALRVADKTIKLPMLIIPGVHPNVVGVALGYGRTEHIGKAVMGVGKNVFPFLRYQNNAVQYFAPLQGVANTGESYPIAYTQTHNSYEGREEVVREFTLAEFKKNPQILEEKRKEIYDRYGEGVVDEQTYESKGTLYPPEAPNGIKWGLSIDLNACFGCGACVVSCNAENNVSVVGKKQVMRSHEMHWLRIDRYFSGDVHNPQVVFQPMLCQHCNQAPCENVCPVGATMHSAEGLNHMAYNRCVGTRYCANNCPYKVRRFNWLDWNGADSFENNQQPLVDEGTLDEVIMDMNKPLTRMVLNPDVVARSRGVIEKCSFCIQRLQAAKTKAKKEGRPVADGEAVPACAEACPTNALVFGNVMDKKSEIYKKRNEEKERVFYVLEQLHVLPNISYMAKIRNEDA